MASTLTKDKFSKRWMKLLEELKKVNRSPRATIMLCCCYIEWLVNSLLEKVCKEGKHLVETDYIPLKAKILLLYEVGIITSDLYYDVGLLLDERNKAVHRVKYQFDHSIKNKLKYPKTAKRHVEELRRSKVPWVCISMYLLSEIANIVFEKYFR